jgi:hypothetical protein
MVDRTRQTRRTVMTVKWVLGRGRVCQQCFVSTGTHEECVEVDGKLYHAHHNPVKLNCRVSRQLSLFEPV